MLNIDSSIIHTRKRVSNPSAHQHVSLWCIHTNGILFRLRKEIPATWLNLENIILSDIRTVLRFHLCELLRPVKFTETENRMVVTKGWGGVGDEELVLVGIEL